MPEPVAADFTEDRALFVRRAEDALRSAEARLADSEAKARWADRGFRPCDDDGDQHARLDEGDAERLKAVGEAAAKRDERLRPALEQMSRRDPAAAVREAARKAIEPAKGEKP
jgi:hypothetical protein